MDIHSKYMSRCLQLAIQGAGYVAPNPMVGAVLVHNDNIIGEGFHQQFGGQHAEVNCINSVKEEDRKFISHSILYVSLEPCAHFGKTPPCTDLIIKNKIPKVIIGCRDPFKEVDGKGIEKLKAADIIVELGVLERECIALNKRFFTFHTKQRPYIILKWAETMDGKVARKGKERLLISNEYSNRLVHKWRSEESSIFVGTNTALMDNPELNARLWPGKSPVRLVLDLDLRLPSSLKLFDRNHRTIVFNKQKHEEQEMLSYYKIEGDGNIIKQVIDALYSLKIQSVIVEGGATLLQSFIEEGTWDEARIIKSSVVKTEGGLAAPVLTNEIKIEQQIIKTDKIEVYYNKDLEF